MGAARQLLARRQGREHPARVRDGQAKRALEIIERALAEAGSTLAEVVRTHMFIRSIGDWQAVLRAHGEAFGEVRPATTLVAVSDFIDPAILVEIEAEAVVGLEAGS